MDFRLQELLITLKMYCKLEKIYRDEEILEEIKERKENLITEIRLLNKKKLIQKGV